jgi:hypothetical protein
MNPLSQFFFFLLDFDYRDEDSVVISGNLITRYLVAVQYFLLALR